MRALQICKLALSLHMMEANVMRQKKLCVITIVLRESYDTVQQTLQFSVS